MSDTTAPPDEARNGPSEPGSEAGPDHPTLPIVEDDSAGYRVLARKYRPQTFEALIGQEPMVRTLSNSFATGRIAQAWMLTGVRGVGKTTTARILARALNYEREGVDDGPTMDLSTPGVHCQAIMEGRHIDVIEMDAASHTSINDIREIIDASRYRPASARYKVYLIDEVHMLSGAAFNGLLKTLEEPPPHVKFIFATTEIRKVPVTILSRCQRFDLRRIESPLLIGHLETIAQAEGVTVEADALRAIARAAEGSVRDALSLLDQAIAHGAGAVNAAAVGQMLGLADHSRIIDLFEAAMRGETAAALKSIGEMNDIGADPVAVLTGMAEFTHFVTRLKHVPETGEDPAVSEDEKTRGAAFADGLSVRILSRFWQILLAGIDEVKAASRPLAAAEMVLVRLCYAADLPTPDEVLKSLGKAGGNGTSASSQAKDPGPSSPDGSAMTAPPISGSQAPAGGGRPVLAAQSPAPVVADKPAEAVAGPEIHSLADIAEMAAERRDLKLKFELERYARLIRFEPGRIEIAIDSAGPPDLAGNLGRRLSDWTGRRWIVAVGRESDEQTLHEAAEARQTALINEVRNDPVVAETLEKFPGARIVDVRDVTDEPTDDTGELE